MGLMKTIKQGLLKDDATRAVKEGRSTFVARYWDEVAAIQMTGSVGGASEAIEQVEACGWSLVDMSYSWVPDKNRGVIVLLFRRAR